MKVVKSDRTYISIYVSEPFFNNGTCFTISTIYNILKIYSLMVVPLFYGLVMFYQRDLFKVQFVVNIFLH